MDEVKFGQKWPVVPFGMPPCNPERVTSSAPFACPLHCRICSLALWVCLWMAKRPWKQSWEKHHTSAKHHLHFGTGGHHRIVQFFSWEAAEQETLLGRNHTNGDPAVSRLAVPGAGFPVHRGGGKSRDARLAAAKNPHCGWKSKAAYPAPCGSFWWAIICGRSLLWMTARWNRASFQDGEGDIHQELCVAHALPSSPDEEQLHSAAGCVGQSR